MEWIETTAPTVEAAKDALLDQLGIDEIEAEFDVLEEPKIGLFGKVRQPARVRARIVPVAPRSKDDRRRRSAKPKSPNGNGGRSAERSGADTVSDERTGNGRSTGADTVAVDSAEESGRGAGRGSAPAEVGGRGDRDGRGGSARGQRRPAAPSDREAAPMEGVTEELVSFLTGLVAACGLEATVSSEVDEDGRLHLSIDGSGLGMLIGPAGGMLSVVQDLCRTRLHRSYPDAEYPKLVIDAGGYRAMRSAALAEHVNEIAAEVRSSGQAHSLGVMGSGDRKAVHDLVGELVGVNSVSEGEDPDRRVVIVAAP